MKTLVLMLAKKVLKTVTVHVQLKGDDLHLGVLLGGIKIFDKTFDLFGDGFVATTEKL